MKLTEENITRLFNCNAPNARQTATIKLLFGLRGLKRGWIKNLIGREISEGTYGELMSCKGRKPKGWPRSDWRKPCTIWNE